MWYLDSISVNALYGSPTTPLLPSAYFNQDLYIVVTQMVTATLFLDNNLLTSFPTWNLCHPQQTVVIVANPLGCSLVFCIQLQYLLLLSFSVDIDELLYNASLLVLLKKLFIFCISYVLMTYKNILFGWLFVMSYVFPTEIFLTSTITCVCLCSVMLQGIKIENNILFFWTIETFPPVSFQQISYRPNTE